MEKPATPHLKILEILCFVFEEQKRWQSLQKYKKKESKKDILVFKSSRLHWTCYI